MEQQGVLGAQGTSGQLHGPATEPPGLCRSWPRQEQRFGIDAHDDPTDPTADVWEVMMLKRAVETSKNMEPPNPNMRKGRGVAARLAQEHTRLLDIILVLFLSKCVHAIQGFVPSRSELNIPNQV